MGADSNERGYNAYLRSQGKGPKSNNKIGSQIDRDISKIILNMQKFADAYDLKISSKKVLRAAADIVRQRMKGNAPIGKEKSNFYGHPIKPRDLQKSIKILPFKKSKDVFVGPDIKKAPHAGIVEFGFVNHWSGEFINGSHFVQRTYEQTKDIVKKILIAEAKNEFEKQGVIYGE